MEYMQKFKEKAIERFCRWGKIIQRFPFRKGQPVYCRYSSLLGKYLAFQVLKPLDEEPYPERIGIQFLDWSGDDFISKDVFYRHSSVGSNAFSGSSCSTRLSTHIQCSPP